MALNAKIECAIYDLSRLFEQADKLDILSVMSSAYNGCLVYVTLYQQGHFVKEAALRSRLLTSNREHNSHKSTYRNSSKAST